MSLPFHDIPTRAESTEVKAADRDELCTSCSKIDLYSLFAGPRHHPGWSEYDENPMSATLGTLAEVRANASCSLCRLIKHGFEESCTRSSWASHLEEPPNPTEVHFIATAVRADFIQGTEYKEKSITNLLASMLGITLELSTSGRGIMTGRHWIQLHSPDSFNPLRPLWNGHLVTNIEKSIELVRFWVDNCIKSHGPICNPDRPSESCFDYDLKCINVNERKISRHKVARDEYAVLSYVWGNDPNRYIQICEQLNVHHLDPTPFKASPNH